ncbi:MAG: HU family DNA-binding protein [Mesonia hippocampi]|uniref:HU family DNA-binding protein n=1 Tax=Mesonia hippocampi TaxID=1628250 RepID=UPI003F9CB380
MIYLKTIGKRNPLHLDDPVKYYLQAIGNGYTDLDRLAYLVSNQSTVREADCYAVLYALQHNIIDELKQGKIVKLGTLGHFKVVVKSNGMNLPEKVNPSLIERAKLNFRPGKPIQSMLKTLSYKHITE